MVINKLYWMMLGGKVRCARNEVKIGWQTTKSLPVVVIFMLFFHEEIINQHSHPTLRYTVCIILTQLLKRRVFSLEILPPCMFVETKFVLVCSIVPDITNVELYLRDKYACTRYVARIP